MTQNSFQPKTDKWNTSPPKFNSSPLKNDGWKTAFLLGRPIFRGELLNYRGVNTWRVATCLTPSPGSYSWFLLVGQEGC